MQIQSMRFSFKLLLPKIQSSKLEESINFLKRKRSHVSMFSDFEDFVWYITKNHEEKELAGFQHHFKLVSSRLAEKLWAEGIFIGMSVIESLLFTLIKDSDVDIAEFT